MSLGTNQYSFMDLFPIEIKMIFASFLENDKEENDLLSLSLVSKEWNLVVDNVFRRICMKRWIVRSFENQLKTDKNWRYIFISVTRAVKNLWRELESLIKELHQKKLFMEMDFLYQEWFYYIKRMSPQNLIFARQSRSLEYYNQLRSYPLFLERENFIHDALIFYETCGDLNDPIFKINFARALKKVNKNNRSAQIYLSAIQTFAVNRHYSDFKKYIPEIIQNLNQTAKNSLKNLYLHQGYIFPYELIVYCQTL